MNTTTTTNTMTLANETVDALSEQLEGFLSGQKLGRRTILRVRLTVEEILLWYQSRLGENAEINVVSERRLWRVRYTISVRGERNNPFEESNDSALLQNFVQMVADATPVWSYHRGCNNIIVDIPVKKNISTSVWILFSVVSGSLLGLVGKHISPNIGAFLNDSIFQPVSSVVWQNTTACPLLSRG